MDTDITRPNKQPFASGPNPASDAPKEFSSFQPEPAPAPVQNTPESPVIKEEKPKKKSNALTLLFALIALCGVAFGVYGMFFQPPKTVTKTVEAPCECDCAKNQESTPQASSNYIQISEWGIKIKLPESLKNTAYILSENGGILITGIKSDTEVSLIPEFALLDKNPSGLGSLSRIPITEETCTGPECGLVYQDENYKYLYGHPQAIYSTNETDQALEAETVSLIQEILTNPENYSKISNQ